MPDQTIRAMPKRVTVLAALWVTLCWCLEESPWSGCDNGKILLDMDLPKDAAHWDCPAPSLWTQAQRLSSVDTVYDPAPANLTCMNQHIKYNQSIPNSGTFRPVSAESGEYLYCPPQRWLNNLHHGATVLLYHPCLSLHERQLLSALAQSCLNEFILTPHKNLDKKLPIALVSWSRTLEISTITLSSDICIWLNTTNSAKHKATQQRHKSQYNLLLTRSVNQDHHKEKKGSVKQCCEQTISSLLEVLKKTQQHSNIKTEIVNKHNKRRIRAALKLTTNLPSVTNVQTGRSFSHQLQSKALPKMISSQRGSQSSTKEAVDRTKSLKENLLPKQIRPNILRTTVSNVTLIQKLVPSALNAKNIEKSENITKIQSNVFKLENRAEVAKRKDSEIIALEEREIESINTGLDSVTKFQTVSRIHNDCQCKFSQVCECSNATGYTKGTVLNQVFGKTSRTDEAVWAAGALGFLLGLLTLCILHTRLYRHWRRGSSLYWHDPQQDYDSVADVIRRRLRLANRRRKRGRKKECVLLPSSSSSEEYP